MLLSGRDVELPIALPSIRPETYFHGSHEVHQNLSLCLHFDACICRWNSMCLPKKKRKYQLSPVDMQAQNFRARTPRSPRRLSVGFEAELPERVGKRHPSDPYKKGREAPFEVEGLEPEVSASRSWREAAGIPRYSVHQSPRVCRLVTHNPPVGAGFAVPVPPSAKLTIAVGNVSSGLSREELPLNATTSFFVDAAVEPRDNEKRMKPTLGAGTLKKQVEFPHQTSHTRNEHQAESYEYVRPSLRPAAHFRALDMEYDYETVAKQAAEARARQRQAYQDALVEITGATAATVVKGVINVVGEIIRQRELARLKREAQERERLALEEFERKCIELVIVRVIQARDIPMEAANVREGPAPYIWITTAPKGKKRGVRKATSDSTKKASSIFSALKSAAGIMGIGKDGNQKYILTEAFTEIGFGTTHIWDEEFVLSVDKVGDRALRVEAVDDRLKFGKDNVGLSIIPVQSLSLGQPEKSKQGKYFQAVGQVTEQWIELSDREINRDDEEMEMIIQLVEAKGLAAADKGGTSDPFCTLELEKQKYKSKVEKKTLDPKWGQAFKFALGTYGSIFVEREKASLKETGSAILSKLHKSDVFKDIAQHGMAALAAITDEEEERRQAADKAYQDANAPAILYISVLKAKDLIAADSGGTSDPYVRMHVGKEIANGKRTKVLKKTLNPEWNEHFEINIREKQRSDELTIEVFDKVSFPTPPLSIVHVAVPGLLIYASQSK